MIVIMDIYEAHLTGHEYVADGLLLENVEARSVVARAGMFLDCVSQV